MWIQFAVLAIYNHIISSVVALVKWLFSVAVVCFETAVKRQGINL